MGRIWFRVLYLEVNNRAKGIKSKSFFVCSSIGSKAQA
jgi:hypothetical protein